MGGVPQRRDPIDDVKLERSELVDEIVAMDSETLGFERRIDLEFLARDRPLFLACRGDETIAYAFGSNGTNVGPASVTEPELLPGVLAALDTEAAAAGYDEIRYTLPGPASAAIRWALDVGDRIDPLLRGLVGGYFSDPTRPLPDVPTWIHLVAVNRG